MSVELENIETGYKLQQKEVISEPIVSETNKSNWNWYQKFALRVVVVFIIQLNIPVSTRFYNNNIYNVDWNNFTWLNVSAIGSGFGAPEFITLADKDIWDLYSYINIFLAVLTSTIAAVIWTFLDRKRKEYNNLYYWILVVARYRLAYGIIAWGYKKLIPIQMEPPSRSFLETAFGDFSEQKIYWQSVGITQGYEVFLGFIEVLCGALLLFRKTTEIGAALTVIVMINIVIANHAYEGMVHVHSFTFVLFAGIILWPYLPGVYNLLIKEQNVIPEIHYANFSKPWEKYTRLGLKVVGSGIFVFFLLYLHSIDNLGYRFPHDHPGLKGAAGVYQVSEFKINNKSIPYSPVDSVRWQEVIFENWTTFTFKVNKLQQMDLDNTGREGRASIDKRFEFRGIGGGRHYFDYQADTIKHILYLKNKNKYHRDQQYVFNYKWSSNEQIILSGINESKDSIYVILDKLDKKYPLHHNRNNKEDLAIF